MSHALDVRRIGEHYNDHGLFVTAHPSFLRRQESIRLVLASFLRKQESIRLVLASFLRKQESIRLTLASFLRKQESNRLAVNANLPDGFLLSQE